jgi:hypothetical protein
MTKSMEILAEGGRGYFILITTGPYARIRYMRGCVADLFPCRF